MDQDVETQFHTIDLFIRSVLDDMDKVSKSTRKIDIMAYIECLEDRIKNCTTHNKYIMGLFDERIAYTSLLSTLTTTQKVG